MSKPHKHAALIKAWADGATIEIRNDSYGSCECGPEWRVVSKPLWEEYKQYRVQPKYPKSTLEYSYLLALVNHCKSSIRLPGEGFELMLARTAVDEAVAEFIKSGEMVKYYMNPANGFVFKE